MAQTPSLDFQAFVERKRHERVTTGGLAESTGHEYAYVSDKQTRVAFERTKPVELAVAAPVRLFKQVLRNQLLGNAVKVGPASSRASTRSRSTARRRSTSRRRTSTS